MSPSKPSYIDYGPRETAPPPFVAGKGEFLGLILKGDLERIREMCDRALNRPFTGRGERSWSPYTYRPFSDAVLLFAGEWDGLFATTRAGEGTADEEQVSLWVPLKARHKVTGAERNCVMVPYMFVDNPMSLLNGREDYGYPKSLGRFENGKWDGKSIMVEAFGGVFRPGGKATWSEVIRVLPTERTPAGSSGSTGRAAQSADPPFDAGVVAEILETGVNQVFLKQFRDAQSRGKACYQCLIEAPVYFQNPRVIPRFSEWKVEIVTPPPNTHPITADLGLRTDCTPFAFSLSSGLRLEAGNVVDLPSRP